MPHYTSLASPLRNPNPRNSAYLTALQTATDSLSLKPVSEVSAHIAQMRARVAASVNNGPNQGQFASK